MSIKSYQWSGYHLLISYMELGGHTVYSVLTDHVTQEDVIEWIIKSVSVPVITQVIDLDETSFEILRPIYVRKRRLIE